MATGHCDHCGQPFNPAAGPHGCAESRPKPDLVDRLREDHLDTIECEHGFMLHRYPCPNVVCLARDLAEAADTIERLRGDINFALECFDAAVAEGLYERIPDTDGEEPGSLSGIFARRINWIPERLRGALVTANQGTKI